jgi:hypothetical protein
MSTNQEWEIGKTYQHTVKMLGKLYNPQPIHVLRQATKEEFIQYWMDNEGFRPIIKPEYPYYYEVSVD